jgi:hypothetical protein
MDAKIWNKGGCWMCAWMQLQLLGKTDCVLFTQQLESANIYGTT